MMYHGWRLQLSASLLDRGEVARPLHLARDGLDGTWINDGVDLDPSGGERLLKHGWAKHKEASCLQATLARPSCPVTLGQLAADRQTQLSVASHGRPDPPPIFCR